jgi:hypothetical protein
MNVELLIAKYGIVGTLENIEDGKVAIPDRQVGMLKDRLYAIKGSDLEGEAFWQAELLMHRAASGDAEAKAKVTALSMVTSQDFLGLGSGFARLTGDEQRAYEIKRDAITAYFRERLVNENPTLGYITGAPVVQLAAAAGLGFGANAAVTVGMRVAPMATSTAVAGATGLYTYNVGATAVEYIQEGDYAGLGAFIMTEGLNLGAFMYGAGVGAKAITEMTTNTVTKPNFIVKPLQDAKLAGEHFAKVRPTIETAAKLSKINPNIEVIYTEMSGWAAASRDSLFLDVLKPAKELINRITIEHEVSGHMKAFQTRFKTEADFQRYESKVKAMRKGANSWLDENEANSMIKVIHGDEIFKQRVDSLVGEIKEIYSWKDRYPVIYLEAIRKPDFIEQLASIENLENLAGISKDITGNVRKDLIVNRFVSTEDYNKIINVMSENTNNILNGRIVPENAIMEQHEIIAKIIYGG